MGEEKKRREDKNKKNVRKKKETNEASPLTGNVHNKFASSFRNFGNSKCVYNIPISDHE